MDAAGFLRLDALAFSIVFSHLTPEIVSHASSSLHIEIWSRDDRLVCLRLTFHAGRQAAHFRMVTSCLTRKACVWFHKKPLQQQVPAQLGTLCYSSIPGFLFIEIMVYSQTLFLWFAVSCVANLSWSTYRNLSLGFFVSCVTSAWTINGNHCLKGLKSHCSVEVLMSQKEVFLLHLKRDSGETFILCFHV